MDAKLYNLIDIFGINIGLRYLNEEQYRSKFGAFATILITGFIVAQIIFVGSELFLKEKPDVIFSERYVQKPERYDFTPTTYNLAFGAQFPSNYTHFMDPSIYTVTVQQDSMKKVFNEETQAYDQVWNSIDVKTHPCSADDFQVQSSKGYFNQLSGVENMFCLDLTSDELFIEGNFDQDAYGTLKIVFKLCDSKTSSVKCQDNISDILTNSFVAMYFNDLIVNPKSYYPFSTIGRDAFWNASPQYPKDATVYYRNIYVESDKGILFEDKMFERSTAVSYIDQQTIFGENSYYFTIYLRFEKSKETIYHRKYKKVDSLLAEIGGVAKALMIIGILLFQPINKLNLHQAIANSLFIFRKDEHQHAKEQQTTQQKLGKLTDLIEDHRKMNTQRLTPMISTNRQINVDGKEDINQPEFSHHNIVFTNPNLRKPAISSHFGNANNQNQNNNQNVQFSTMNEKEDTNREMLSGINTPHPLLSNNEQSQQPYFLNPNKAVPNNNSNLNQGIQKQTLKLLDIIKQRNRLAESAKVATSSATNNNVNSNANINTNTNFVTQGIQSNQQNIDDLSKPTELPKSIQRKRQKKEDNINENVKNVFKSEKQSDSLELKWTDYIKYYLWPFGEFKKKQQQIDYSIETIYSHLDMLYIVRKLLELEKLKQLLLNEDQIKLIQFFPKPYIDVDKLEIEKKTHKKNKTSEINILNNTNQKSEKEKAVEAFKALQNIIQKPYLSDIDKKILEMLDGSILENIENNEDYLKELQESIEIDENEMNEIKTNQFNFNLPLNTGERNLTQQQDNHVLEIYDMNKIEVKRLNMQQSLKAGQQQSETNLQQQPESLSFKYDNRQQNNNNNQLKYKIEMENYPQIELKQCSEDQPTSTYHNILQVNSNEQISQFNLPIMSQQQLSIPENPQNNKMNQNQLNNDHQLIKFEESNLNSSSESNE